VLLGDGHGGFGNATNFVAGSRPACVAISDLNGDGRPDLAVANAWSNSVSVLLGDGQGGFGNATEIPVGSTPYFVAVGDLNRDGKPDLVVANVGSSSVSVLLNQGTTSPFFEFCYGADAVAMPCPCGNSGLFGHGCQNSASTGGAMLAAAGTTSPDTVVLTSSGELANVPSIFLQGHAAIPPTPFGDGLRCIGGTLERLYVKYANSGSASAPQSGDASITARSAALGDPIALGSMRYYQVCYRDPALGFCAPPAGNSWNVGSAVGISW
jgi:hypothetical protein